MFSKYKNPLNEKEMIDIRYIQIDFYFIKIYLYKGN